MQSLVKIHPLVQKIKSGKEATWTGTRMPTGSAPKSICPPPIVAGYLFDKTNKKLELFFYKKTTDVSPFKESKKSKHH